MLGSISYKESIGFPLLSIVVFLPAIGALFLMLINSKRQTLLRCAALAVAGVDFVISLFLLVGFRQNTAKMQFVEKFAWFKAIGSSYHLGVDGISLFLVILTTLMGVLVVLACWRDITSQVKELMICLLLLQTGMLGTFVALDLLLFYVFWEAMLPPMYLIIGIWGSSRRIYSTLKFFIFTIVGSFPMVLGIMAIYFNYHNYAIAYNIHPEYTFDLLKLYQVNIPMGIQAWVFWTLFVGFAVKVPMFPIHTWLPDAHTDAPTVGSVILAGILLKMGTYGFIRFSLPLLPDACREYGHIALILSAIAIIYASWVAFNQEDMKKLIAYSSIGHMGYITMGIFVLNQQGISGGVIQMLNHGVSTGALFLMIGMIYERRHTRLITEYGGLFKQIPWYTTFFVIVMLSSMGAPGFNGFVGELLILMGTFKVSMTFGIVCILGILGCSAYLLWLFQRAMLGEITNPANHKLKDLNFREVMILVPLVIMIFWVGLYPKPFLDVIDPSVENLVAMMRSGPSSAK
ncbi:MAG: NADH-quinone oxidoreductase subunit M [Candidatus Schekmanbacteria bacterium]|nr:NADH-quinone oxidoreductase subunit M [Candidatus Schekmanbacteria bacterium]